MSGLGYKVSSRPKVTIAIILVLTIIFGYFGSSFVNVADPESFNPDHELINASGEAGELFGTEEYRIMVLVKAKDGNLLQIEDMKTLIALEDTLRNDEEIATALAPSSSNPTGFMSIADILVLSYNLTIARAGMDYMLTGMNQSLSGLAVMLENPMITNETKANALMGNLTVINATLAAMQTNNGNNMPEFNKNASIDALDAISQSYGPDPVPNFLYGLQQHDTESIQIQTSYLTTSINSSINAIIPYLDLLQDMSLDPENGTMILMGLSFALPSMEAGAASLDDTIVGMYFGAMATLTMDFTESEGSLAQGTVIAINFNVTIEDHLKLDLEKGVHDTVKEEEGDLKYGVYGNELINDEIQRTMDVSQGILFGLVFILIILILFATFRNAFDTALTLVSLVMAIMWSFGISVMLGLQGSIIAMVVPILLVGLGVDYGIHMTMRFREEKGKGRKNPKAISTSIATVGMALLLATITTSIGFMSNTISSLSVLREFAIMVTIGIVASFIIMTTFLPAVKLVIAEWRDTAKKEKKEKVKANPGRTEKRSGSRGVSLVTFGAKAGDRAPWAVLIVLAIMSGAALYGAMQLDTVFDFRDFIPQDTEAHDNVNYLMDEFPFGEQEYGEFYIKGDITSPGVLAAMQETINRTIDDKQVVEGFQARSILSVMDKYATTTSPTEINQSFIENWTQADSDEDGLPESNVKALFDILYEFEASHNDVISVLHRDENNDNYDAALIQVRVNSDSLRKAEELVKELEDDASPLKQLEDDGTLDKVYVVGGPVVINVVITEMNAGQIQSIIITLIASFFVLTIVFLILERSFVLGLLTSIPVVLVILWILGTMLLLGYSLNVMTITIASLTVGMGITYSIHISERFIEDLKNFDDVGKACENTLTHTGMALAGAFFTTAGGFGILYFHKLPPIQQFGVMIALSITYSFLASAYVLPTFLILWAKWRKNYRKKKGGGEKEDAEAESVAEEQAEEEDVGGEEADAGKESEEHAEEEDVEKEEAMELAGEGEEEEAGE